MGLFSRKKKDLVPEKDYSSNGNMPQNNQPPAPQGNPYSVPQNNQYSVSQENDTNVNNNAVNNTVEQSNGNTTVSPREESHIDLKKKAQVSLEKHKLTNAKAAVYLVIDHSGSMRKFYKDGTVRNLIKRCLAVCETLDDDGIVPVLLFDTFAHEPVEVNVKNFDQVVDNIINNGGKFGQTDYAAAMKKIIEMHNQEVSDYPALVIFQTDGAPKNRKITQDVLCDASTLPIFWQFIGFGDDEFAFLKKLDNLPDDKRMIDNAGFFEAGIDPDQMSSEELYDNLLNEFPDWLQKAKNMGIVNFD